MREGIVTELIMSSLAYASEEMGITLRNSSYSPNIRDRMDHSCAILDAGGRLLAQAEHIPVHLGSLPWGLKKTLEFVECEGMELHDRDTLIVNNPYISGTHLNDITLITPIFFRNRIVAFSASKAHHSDVGGKVPGSIPADATEIFQEGLIIDPVKLLRRGRLDESVLHILSSNSRDPYQRLGDIKAQTAANRLGRKRVQSILEDHGISAFKNASETALNRSERMMRLSISEFPDGSSEAVDWMEMPDMPEIQLKVRIIKQADRILIDYTGTAEQMKAPINAVYGVTLSGVYFVMKCLTDPGIVMNDGCFRPVTVNVPEGTLLNPQFPFPVSAGNTETSMRNADILFKAMTRFAGNRVPAACGGSMNNVMIGGVFRSKTWSFYETNAVGMGASSELDGTDGVHCNMTNTLNSPVELVEVDYPVSIVKYQFREGSGGTGKWRGGCGIERSYLIQAPNTSMTLMSEREFHSPWGLNGGDGGATTEIFLNRGGKITRVPSKCTLELNEGDVVTINTAGGGGYGRKEDRDFAKIETDRRNGIMDAQNLTSVSPAWITVRRHEKRR